MIHPRFLGTIQARFAPRVGVGLGVRIRGTEPPWHSREGRLRCQGVSGSVVIADMARRLLAGRKPGQPAECWFRLRESTLLSVSPRSAVSPGAFPSASFRYGFLYGGQRFALAAVTTVANLAEHEHRQARRPAADQRRNLWLRSRRWLTVTTYSFRPAQPMRCAVVPPLLD
jgi:hypothetical protein